MNNNDLVRNVHLEELLDTDNVIRMSVRGASREYMRTEAGGAGSVRDPESEYYDALHTVCGTLEKGFELYTRLVYDCAIFAEVRDNLRIYTHPGMQNIAVYSIYEDDDTTLVSPDEVGRVRITCRDFSDECDARDEDRLIEAAVFCALLCGATPAFPVDPQPENE